TAGITPAQSDSVKRRGCNLARRQRESSRAATSQADGVITGEMGQVLRPDIAMLSVPTLWTVFVINFLALGLIWAYVMRSYPTFEAARFWTGSAFVAAAGA